MSISQHEAVSLLNHTIFRPGWRVSARPGPGDEVQVRIEVETVDSSFVTRGGEYTVPLTERALALISARTFETAQELLFRVLAFIGELQAHEDREFLRTWDGERWIAPFHSHVPGSAQAWGQLKALPQPPMIRVDSGDEGPWMTDAAWAAHQRIASTGCGEGIDDDGCWENGKRALVSMAGCADNDDDPEEGPQRVLVNAGCADDGAVSCNTNIDTSLVHHRVLARHGGIRPLHGGPRWMRRMG